LPKRRQLAALCWHLAGRVPGGTFFLSVENAGQLLGADPTTAGRWLRGFRSRQLRCIRRKSVGNSRAGAASEYVWLGLVPAATPSDAVTKPRLRDSIKTVR
jgi:hypothetical protein